MTKTPKPLFEDCGNFHDEKELEKSFDNMSKDDKKNTSKNATKKDINNQDNQLEFPFGD